VNFCKFTNETRFAMEDATANSGQTWLAALNGTASGGGYELALACEHIMLVDDRSSAVSLPELPLLGVLPGTGGLTRVVDKRHVRRDLADYFATRAEGLTGRKAAAFYAFRRRPVAQKWDGFSDAPTYANAREIADALIGAFLQPTDEGGVDEIHIVYTRFVSMLTQRAEVIRLLPLEVVEGTEAPEDEDILPLYEFEPDAETVLDELLPLYVASRIQYCLLQAAASELASRQKAMKSATDNAEQLIERLTREANQARQAEITQEISEIVGGASALAEATASAE